MFAGGVTTYRIEGTVSTRRGILTGGVTITLTDSNSNMVETATFDDDINPGWYRFTGLAAGTYTLTASKPCWSFSPSSQSVTITDANATGIDFTSSKNYYSIYGTVTEQGSGDPVAGASLSLYELGTYIRSTVSDGSGEYMFNGLENGGYTITLDSGCVPEGMGSMSAFVNCANVEKNFVCEGGLGESKRQEAASRLNRLKTFDGIDNKGRQADNSDMDATADKNNPSASSLQPSALASSRTEASVAEYLFYHCDHLGTVRLITNASGAVVSRHDYEPFGVEIAPVVETANNTHQFTGHERDKATGYDYMHYRSYGSNLGRFMKPDNITGNPLNPQSWNLYSYVRGNPVNFNDPTGHEAANPEQETTQLTGNGNTQNTPSSSAAITAPTSENATMKKKMVDVTIILNAKELTKEETNIAKEAISKELASNGVNAKVLASSELSLWQKIKYTFNPSKKVQTVNVEKGFSEKGESVHGDAVNNRVFLGPAFKAGLMRGSEIGNYVANISLHETWHNFTGTSDVPPFKPSDWNPKPGTIMDYQKTKYWAVPRHFDPKDAVRLVEALQ